MYARPRFFLHLPASKGSATVRFSGSHTVLRSPVFTTILHVRFGLSFHGMVVLVCVLREMRNRGPDTHPCPDPGARGRCRNVSGDGRVGELQCGMPYVVCASRCAALYGAVHGVVDRGWPVWFS